MWNLQEGTRNPPPLHSIVEYFYPPESDGHRCGYCKRKDTNMAHGMWAHSLSVQNYEALINVGWRRSGCYVYKPMNERICCPMYTIRNHCTKVEVSRSQRKVLKRFSKFLKDGQVDGGPRPRDKNSSTQSSGNIQQPDLQDPEHMNDCEQPTTRSSNNNNGGSGGSGPSSMVIDDEEHQQVSSSSNQASPISQTAALPNPKVKTKKTVTTTGAPAGTSRHVTSSNTTTKKPHPLKRKYLRRERKRQKLLAKGQDPDEFFRRNERNRVRELDQFFNYQEPGSGSPNMIESTTTAPQPRDNNHHKFWTKLVFVDSDEFHEKHFKLEHELYQKYQMSTHGDTEHECRASQFKRFLCDNPFTGSRTTNAPTNSNSTSTASSSSPELQPARQLLGTYHQHYYVDSTLIAVGVLDLLPSCVSSVYFFYDPAYSFLSPGTLGALHEISFVNRVNGWFPHVQYYYLGFYIHSCVKMKYKRKFRPCELVCPVTREWVPFTTRVVKILDSVNGGFARIAEQPDGGQNQHQPQQEKRTSEMVEKVLLLYKRRVFSFPMFPHKSRDQSELEFFVNLVTSNVASNMLVYRPSTPPMPRRAAATTGQSAAGGGADDHDHDDDDDDDEEDD